MRWSGSLIPRSVWSLGPSVPRSPTFSLSRALGVLVCLSAALSLSLSLSVNRCPRPAQCCLWFQPPRHRLCLLVPDPTEPPTPGQHVSGQRLHHRLLLHGPQGESRPPCLPPSPPSDLPPFSLSRPLSLLPLSLSAPLRLAVVFRGGMVCPSGAWSQPNAPSYPPSISLSHPRTLPAATVCTLLRVAAPLSEMRQRVLRQVHVQDIGAAVVIQRSPAVSRRSAPPPGNTARQPRLRVLNLKCGLCPPRPLSSASANTDVPASLLLLQGVQGVQGNVRL